MMSILIQRFHQSLVHERFIKTLKEINNIFNNFLSDDPSKQLFSLQPRLLSVVSKKQILNSVAYNHQCQCTSQMSLHLYSKALCDLKEKMLCQSTYRYKLAFRNGTIDWWLTGG